MIKYKKIIKEFLNKINFADIDSFSDNEVQEFAINEDKKYHKIRNTCINKIEEAKIIADIMINHQCLNNSDHSISKFLNKLLKKTTDDIENDLYNELVELIVNYNIKTGNWLYNQGRTEEALYLWEDALKVNPQNEYIHSKLGGLSHFTNGLQNQVEDIKKKFQFEYIGSFGHDIVRKPGFLIMSQSENELLVSDSATNEIHKFCTNGDYIDSFSFGLDRPAELFKDEDGNVWICDFGNNRLLVIDFAGDIVDSINLKNFTDDGSEIICPTYGCIKGHQIFLILTDITQSNKRKIVVLDRLNLSGSIEIVDFSNDIRTPVGLVSHREQLYVSDKFEGIVYQFDFTQRKFKKYINFNIAGAIYRFFILGNNMFISTRKFLLKLSLTGQPCFVANFRTAIEFDNVNIFGLAGHKKGKLKYLFAGDFAKKCILKFII